MNRPESSAIIGKPLVDYPRLIAFGSSTPGSSTAHFLRNLGIAAHRIDQSSKLGIVVKPQSQRIPLLVGIKLLHTAIWLFFAGCIVAIPFAGAWRQFRLLAVLTGLVLVECAVLAMHRGRCPMTDLAGRYTEDRTANSDIYLPLWLARRNKMIFGTLFAIGELFALGRWLRS